MNYIMDDTRGDRLIQMIKTGHPELICLLSSSSQLDRERFRSVGVDNIMLTPVSMFTLKDLLLRTYSQREEALEDSGTHDLLCPECKADMSLFLKVSSSVLSVVKRLTTNQ